MKCVICDKFAKNKIHDKRRLEVDIQAEKFLKMAKNRFDDVYSCTEGTHTVWCRFILPLYMHEKLHMKNRKRW